MSTLFENIERIQLGKEKLKASIENKDVVVPDDMLIDEYYSLVDQIQTGIGEDFTITDCSYMFNENARLELFDILFPHLSNQPTNITNMFKGTQYNPMNFEYIDRYLEIADFSQCTKVDTWCFNSKINDTVDKIINLDFIEPISARYIFANIIIINPITLYLNINIPKATTIEYGFQNLGLNPSSTDFTCILDFQNTTGQVVTSTSAFYYCNKGHIKIRNLNLDKVRTIVGTFTGATAVEQLTFAGSLGSLSKSASLTLDISGCTKLSLEAFAETMTTISPNESGKTRIFKLPSALYNSLTDDIWDLADEKLYDIASA